MPTVRDAGYLQSAKTSSSRSNATSSGAAGHGKQTLTTHEAPAASPISSAGSTSTTPLTPDGLLGLFKREVVGRGAVLEPATMEDMCGKSAVDKPSLEVVYDAA